MPQQVPVEPTVPVGGCLFCERRVSLFSALRYETKEPEGLVALRVHIDTSWWTRCERLEDFRSELLLGLKLSSIGYYPPAACSERRPKRESWCERLENSWGHLGQGQSDTDPLALLVSQAQAAGFELATSAFH